MIAAVPNYFAQYQKVSGLVLGFHGCDRDVGESVLCGEVRHLSPSVNDYDWLGSGIYFWENDPQRAYEFAVEASQKPHKSAGKIKDPFVVGAIIDLGLCLNFLERPALRLEWQKCSGCGLSQPQAERSLTVFKRSIALTPAERTKVGYR